MISNDVYLHRRLSLTRILLFRLLLLLLRLLLPLPVRATSSLQSPLEVTTMRLRYLLAILPFLLPVTLGYDNLFSDGQLGLLLGTYFGLPGTNATFDYVVVGGGTGGLAIATRLAEDPSVSVAVVEAGGFYEIDNGNLSVTLGYANFYTGADPTNYQPLVDWGFDTVPQAVG